MGKIPILLGNGLYQEWFGEKESQNTSMALEFTWMLLKFDTNHLCFNPYVTGFSTHGDKPLMV